VTATTTSHGDVHATDTSRKDGKDKDKVIETWTITVLARLTGEQCLTQVAPVNPTVVLSTMCGAEGTYTIPTTTGISYLLAGTTIAAGTYPGPASGTVTAAVATGYVLSNPTWSYALSLAAATACPQAAVTQVVTPVNPTVDPSSTCEVQGTYSIPVTTGISYLLDGKAIAAGSYQGPASGLVTAVAATGYTLSTTTWSYALSLAAPAICPAAEAPAATAPVVDAPTTGGTTTESTTALPKTGTPVPAFAITGALALLLGLALYAVGTRRLVRDLS
jgi:LPXTG-motif cell wall-anchored protein